MIHSLFTGLLALPLVLPPQVRRDEDAERDYHPAYASLATGEWPPVLDGKSLYPWPVKLKSIGHSIASYQYYGFGDPYFHHGLDIRADSGSDVIAAAGGKVVNIENYDTGDAYWEIAILDADGYLWQYHHVNRQSMTDTVLKAFQSGEPIAAGTKIGEVYYWPEVTFGERYHHIHLNILGKGKQYLNPFAFLEPLNDTQFPVVQEIGLLKDGEATSEVTSGSEYSLYAEVSDLILHQKFIVPPHSIVYQVDDKAPSTVWAFDTLPGGASNTKYVHDFFVPSMTCGNYTCRKLVVNLSFKPGRHEQIFPTEPGPHKVLLTVKDFAGNTTTKSFSWNVR
jgi:hypothetical protein